MYIIEYGKKKKNLTDSQNFLRARKNLLFEAYTKVLIRFYENYMFY